MRALGPTLGSSACTVVETEHVVGIMRPSPVSAFAYVNRHRRPLLGPPGLLSLPRSGAGCFLCCGRTDGRSLGFCRLACRGRAGRCRTPRGRAPRLFRQRRVRRRAARFPFQDVGHRSRDAWSASGLSLALARLIGVLRALAGGCLGRAFLGWTERNARAPRLRQADCNGLFGRSRSVLATANLANFLVHELARLGGRRLSRAPVLSGLLHRLSFRHHRSPVADFGFRDINVRLKETVLQASI